ncbi:MAG TPA: dihydrofolate reductase family protein [Candidatus Thermoplasmatota archaeon]|nr:dihydrofolate reductase family protein [Candidatus Thermoplasmatota archaeon]
MGKLIVGQFMTLDGVVQSPGMPEEDAADGFRHGGWQVPYFDQEFGEAMGPEMARSDALLLGRKTYDIFASYWPKAPADDPAALKLNAMPKYVASRTMKRADWQNTTLLRPDLKAEVARIKGLHKEVHVIGSGDLVQSLLRERLVDELDLWVYPLVLGSGKKLFASGTVPAALKLTRSRTFGNGALLLTYEPVGEPTYGTTALG